jgi:pimeloyl-ACP methyl ester carboxylesterase
MVYFPQVGSAVHSRPFRAIFTRAVVVGEHDPGTPVSAAELIRKRISSSELRVISDAAHFINVEQTSVFNNELLEFIEKNSI